MAHERWMKMVEKASFFMEEDGEGLSPVLFVDVAVGILAKQHAEMVGRIEKLDRYRQGVHIMLGDPDGEFVLRNDILAALAKQGGGGR